MRLGLDYLERSLTLGFGAGTSKSQQLNEHQNLLQRRAQLVGHVGQKSLARLHETNLAAQRCEAGDGEDDAPCQQEERRGNARLRNSAHDEVLRNVGSQRDPVERAADEWKLRASVIVGGRSVLRRLVDDVAIQVGDGERE